MNNWKWRDEEKSYKQFIQLPKEEKQQHINFLLTLEPDILGTNDKYILLNFGPAIKSNVKNLLSIND